MCIGISDKRCAKRNHTNEFTINLVAIFVTILCHRLAVILTRLLCASCFKKVRVKFKGKVGGGSCANRKPTHDFPILLNTKSCSLPLFHRSLINSMSNYSSPPSLPIPVPRLGASGKPMGSILGPIEMPPLHSYSTTVHTTGLSCTV